MLPDGFVHEAGDGLGREGIQLAFVSRGRRQHTAIRTVIYFKMNKFKRLKRSCFTFFLFFHSN